MVDEQLYQQFRQVVLSAVRSVLARTHYDAIDDVEQDSWVTIAEKMHTVRDAGALKDWIYTTSRNKALDYLRGAREIPISSLKQRQEFHDEETGAVEAKAPWDDVAGGVKEFSPTADLTGDAKYQRKVLQEFEKTNPKAYKFLVNFPQNSRRNKPSVQRRFNKIRALLQHKLSEIIPL